MAKIEIASEEITQLVNDVAREKDLLKLGVRFKVFSTNKSKEVIKIKKVSSDAETILKRETNSVSEEVEVFVITVFEKAFERVNQNLRRFWIEQALDMIVYDLDKDKISLSSPVICIPISTYHKYGNVACQNMEMALMTLQQLEDEEKNKGK